MTTTIAIIANTIEAIGITKNAIIANAIASRTITTRITTIRIIRINTITAAVDGTIVHAMRHAVQLPVSLNTIYATATVIATKTISIVATKS